MTGPSESSALTYRQVHRSRTFKPDRARTVIPGASRGAGFGHPPGSGAVGQTFSRVRCRPGARTG